MKLRTLYAFGRKFNASFAEIEEKVREELAKENYGILTEINVNDTFKKKLDRDFRDYVILGACNPTLAWDAFAKEINIGTLMPCNVVVYRDDDDKTIVMVMDPVAALGLIGNADLTDNAVQVRAKMEQILDTLSNLYG